MSYGKIRESFSEPSLGASEQEIARFHVNHVERISGDISVTGDPLASFTIAVVFHSRPKEHDMFTTAQDYNQPEGALVGANTDLTTLSGDGWFLLDTRAMSEVVIKASSAGVSAIEVLIGG